MFNQPLKNPREDHRSPKLKAIALLAAIAVLIGSYLTLAHRSSWWPFQTAVLAVTNRNALADSTVDSMHGWLTFHSASYGFEFRYPPGFGAPIEWEDGAKGQYAIKINSLQLEYFSPARNQAAGLTLQNFISMSWVHSPSDVFTYVAVAGEKGARYDLVLPVLTRTDKEKASEYQRWIQIGLETPNSGFLELHCVSKPYENTSAAQEADLRYCDQLLSTFEFLGSSGQRH